MGSKNKASRLALCGVLAGLALAILFLGGVIPFAAITCPVMASLVLIPVYCECGRKWGWSWYLAVGVLALLLVSDREASILFVFLGYYPMLKKYFERLPLRWLKWLAKLLYVNAAILCAYTLMIYVFGLTALGEELKATGTVLLIATMLLANVSFVLYDVLIGRLEIFWFVRLRPKLKL